MRKIHYVLSTHWDREWHLTFQKFRYRLVHLMDEVLDGLSNGQLKGPFQTDGQTILLEDYLEIRPEREDEIKSLIQDGKLCIGPWYTMPDEFLVSGESLMRNLEQGRKVCAELGAESSPVGFVCDIFGHCSQLPQIFRQSGLNSAVIWRGVNIKDNRLVNWCGADGEPFPTYIFGSLGYGGFALTVRRVHEPGHRFDAERFKKELHDFIREELAATSTDSVMVFDGCDHQYWDRQAYQVVEELFKNGFEGHSVVHTSLDEFISEILSQKDRFVDVVHGELHLSGQLPEEGHRWLLSDVLSSWMPLKLKNYVCQTELCSWAEPYSAAEEIWLGTSYPQAFLDLSWKWLLQNHAHDSICGCSVDRVHEDMKFRFNQSLDISTQVANNSFQTIAGSIDAPLEDGSLNVILFNSQATERDTVVELALDVPLSWPSFKESKKFEPLPSFRIYDMAGKEVPYQRLSMEPQQTRIRLYETKVPEKTEVCRMRIALPVQLPALGYTTLNVRSAGENSFVRGEIQNGMACGLSAMQNEFVHVEICPNGTFILTDKQSGKVYNKQMLFEDVADIGDGWDFCRPLNSMTYTSAGSHSEIILLHDGPFQTSYRVRTHLYVPACFEAKGACRSEDLKDLLVDSTVTLRKDSPEVDLETTVHNCARDHRLRVLFESDCDVSTYFSDTPFDVVERDIDLPENNSCLREMKLETNPQQSWTAVFDGNDGLAVLTAGVMESAVLAKPGKPIALTLFRSTQRVVFDGCGPGGQLQEPMTFRCRLIPLHKSFERKRLFESAQQLAAGTRTVQTDAVDVEFSESPGRLPSSRSLFELTGDAVVSSVRMVNGRLQIRLFNPEAEATSVMLNFENDYISKDVDACKVDCLGTYLSALTVSVDRSSVDVPLQSKEICTVSLGINVDQEQA